MKIRREGTYKLPYALHDAKISSMHLHKAALTLDFAEGFYDLGRDCAIKGSVFFDKIDSSFSEVFVYKRHGRKIKGKVLSLKKFIKKYNEEELEIINEYYDDYSAKYEGIIHEEDDDERYFELNIISLGNMYYLLDADDLDEEVEEDEELEEEEEIEDVASAIDDLEKALSDQKLPWNERVLVKNTTYEQRKKIVEDSLGGDVTCAGDDVIAEMYNDYIDGKIELADINREYMKMMGGH